MASGTTDLNTLPIEALSQIRQRADAELEFMGSSIATLRKALLSFEHVKLAAGKVAESRDGQDCLMPVGSTLFVKGKLEEPNKVLVDVGAGYFIEMSAERAVDHYTRKVDGIKAQVDQLRGIIQQKAALREVVTATLQKKIQAATAQNPPAAAK